MKISKPATVLLLLALICSIHAFSQTTLKVQSGATIDLNGGVVLTLNDVTLDNDGTLNPAVGAGRVLFKGSANTFIRGAGITNFAGLEIAKTGKGILTFQTNSDIRSGIWFNGGLIDLGNRVVSLLGTAVLYDESEDSRMMSTGNGYVQASMQLNAPKEMNPGNLGAVISSSQNLGFTSIRRGHEHQTIEGGRTSILRYFDIVPENNAALNATFTMLYADAELDRQSESALEFRVLDGGKWTKLKADRRSTTTNYVQVSGINIFSRITLADDGVGLPVTFKLFNVDCGNNETVVTWVTASEQNSSHFDVQRSADGTTWTTIATLPAAGNSNTDKRYTYTDQNPQGKFYRVKEVDLDGQIQYSLAGVADCATGNNFKVWPNPVQDQLFVTIKADRISTAVINIFNNEGKLAKKQNSGLLGGSNRIAVNMQNLVRGIYHVEVVWNDGVRKALTVVKK